MLRTITSYISSHLPEMWPFPKKPNGYFHKAKYRVIESYGPGGRYFLWDRNNKKVIRYYKNKDEAMLDVELNNLDCDAVGFFT